MRLVAKTMYGLERSLAVEIEQLGGANVVAGNRMVEFEGDLETMYRVNLWSRLALRVLYPVDKFTAKEEDELYRKIRRINWSQYLTHKGSLLIDAVAFSSIFRHSKYVALKTKDAIVDQFRDKTGRRPSVDKIRPTIRIHIHIDRNEVSVYLDAGAESLHKRGYRGAGQEAPLSEVLAAGIVALSNWDGTTPLVDPMCGSGTIAIEAAMMAAGLPPRNESFHYGFMRWNDFDKELWEKVKAAPAPKSIWIKEGVTPVVYASDKSPNAIRRAEIHAENAGVSELITFEKIDFHKIDPPGPKGVVIMNPPYGERLQLEKVEEFYTQIGETLKEKWKGWEAWIFSGNPDGIRWVALRSSMKKKMFNGAIECRLCRYEIFEELDSE